MKIGFNFEMVQKNHVIVRGRNQDTAWFSIIDSEWERVKERLETRILAFKL